MAHGAARTNFVGATTKERRKWEQKGVRTYAQALSFFLRWAWKKVKAAAVEAATERSPEEWSHICHQQMTDYAWECHIWMTASGKAWGFNVKSDSGRIVRVYFPVSMQDKKAGARMLDQKIREALAA